MTDSLRYSKTRLPMEVAQDFTPPLLLHRDIARATHEQRREMMGRILSQMLQGKRIGLVCSCAPMACHGDVIASKLVRMYCATARHVAADLKQFCRGDGRVRARVRVFEKRKGSRAP